MKKVLIAVVLLFSPLIAKTDMVAVSDQFKAALVNDMTAVYAHTSHNEDKAYVLTSLIQFGHYKKDYIVAGDFGGVLSSGEAVSIHKTYGIHLHVIPFVLEYVPMNPDLSKFLSFIELTPRYSFDEDTRHGVLSYIFGAKVSY